MSLLTIRHTTTYRYRQPVAFGEHRMMLRPRDFPGQRVIEAALEISPKPRSLRFAQDGFGNHVGIARFSDRAKELRFASTVSIEHAPAVAQVAAPGSGFPVAYGADEKAELAPYIGRHHPDPENAVGRWAERFLPQSGAVGAFELLTLMSQAIHRDFRYRRREAKGVQLPAETLRLGQGSCRDFALLLIEAARALGFAARFASGYLAIPLDHADDATARGATHAWAQIHVPATGWIDFDPTSNSIGRHALVTVALVRDPYDAIPLHGTFIGYASDHLGMDVQVDILTGI